MSTISPLSLQPLPITGGIVWASFSVLVIGSFGVNLLRLWGPHYVIKCQSGCGCEGDTMHTG